MRARSKPIIEHSSRVRFAPLALKAAEAGSEGADEGMLAASAPKTSSPKPTEGAVNGAPSSGATEAEDARLRALLVRHRLGEETGMYANVGLKR